MPDEITMPVLAIGGGFTLLFALACIFVATTRRRTPIATRRTRFHAVIDPRVAELGRAAFEDVRPIEVSLEDVEQTIHIPAPPPPRPNMNVRMHYLQREPAPPRRLARGSTPGIVIAPPAHTSDRANDWDMPTAPSVTAQLRAYRR